MRYWCTGACRTLIVTNWPAVAIGCMQGGALSVAYVYWLKMT